MATFTKRGERWFVQVKKQGIRKSKSFDTKAAGRVWATRMEAELEASSARDYSSAGRLTMADLVNRYVQEVKPIKRWGRTKDYSLALIRDRMGAVLVQNVNAQHLIAYARSRVKEGAGPVSVQMELSYLGSVFRVARAVWRIDIGKDVVPDAREALKLLGMVGKSKQRDRVAKAAELERIKAAWASEVPPSIIDFAIATAMRLGEIVSLRWSDYDADARTILVRDRKHPTEKVGNNQLVPLLNGAPAIISAIPPAGELIWPHKGNSVGAAWQRACKRADIKDLRFHDLRHTGITHLFQQGYSIEQVALVSGHKNWAMLKRYTHVTAKDVLAALKNNT